MDFNAITELIQSLAVPTVTLSCLVFGHILKKYVPMENRHIPLTMATVGILVTLLISKGYVSFEDTILAGAINGLASTGMHQVFTQYMAPKEVA